MTTNILYILPFAFCFWAVFCLFILKRNIPAFKYKVPYALKTSKKKYRLRIDSDDHI